MDRQSTLSKLALGTANFGQIYGLNKSHGLSMSDKNAIIQSALSLGIKSIDTAQAYGNAEDVLGEIGVSEFAITSKVLVSKGTGDIFLDVVSSVKESIKKLGIGSLQNLLLHSPADLLCPEGMEIVRALKALKEQGLVTKVGFSIYDSEILDKLIPILEPEIVQVPFNLFDQGIVTSGWSQRLKERNTEIHTRSTFLQGLLLLGPDELPHYFRSNWDSLFAEWHHFLDASKLLPEQACLQFCIQQPWIDKVVVGVEKATQLESLRQIEQARIETNFPDFRTSDPLLINPSKWKKS